MMRIGYFWPVQKRLPLVSSGARVPNLGNCDTMTPQTAVVVVLLSLLERVGDAFVVSKRIVAK